MNKIIRVSCFAAVVFFALLVCWKYLISSSRYATREIGPDYKAAVFEGRRPPIPNLKCPVDYVDWANQHFAEGRRSESNCVYDYFWRYSGDDIGMLDPSSAVVERLNQLAYGPKWIAGQQSDVEAYMESVGKYMDIFSTAAQEPEYSLQLEKDIELPGNFGIMPWTVSGKYAVQVLLAQGWREGSDQFERMSDAWEISLQHATHLLHSRAILGVVRGNSIQEIVYKSMRHALHYELVMDGAYDEVIGLMCRTEKLSIPPTESLYTEWGITLNFVQSLYQNGRLNKGLAQMLGGVNLEELSRSKVAPVTLVSAIDDYFIKILDITKHTVDIHTLEKVKSLQRELDKGSLGEHPLRRIMFPGSDRVIMAELRSLTAYRATVVLFLLHQYYGMHKTWPASISDISIGEQFNCLSDPFSGQAFRYKMQGASFVLYSVGEDYVDNGGQHEPWNRWTQTREGVDFVFWPIQ